MRQVGTAVEPLKRSFPRWELNMPVGSFAAGRRRLALLLEVANTSIRHRGTCAARALILGSSPPR